MDAAAAAPSIDTGHAFAMGCRPHQREGPGRRRSSVEAAAPRAPDADPRGRAPSTYVLRLYVAVPYRLQVQPQPRSRASRIPSSYTVTDKKLNIK